MATPFQEACQLIRELGDYLKIDQKYPGKGITDRLTRPDRVITFRATILRDSGVYESFECHRSQHCGALGPYKGGIRFHPGVNLDEVQALSVWMSLKCSLAGLPYGGGKGGITVDAKALSAAEKERLCRAYVNGLWRYIGPDLDVPAPDVNTGAPEMAWMTDEYEKHAGHANGVFTGKPLSLGGSQGRPAATGNGLTHCTMEAIRDLGIKKPRVAIQGFGNVARFGALGIVAEGGVVVAVSNTSGVLYNPEGIDIKALIAHCDQTGNKLAGFAGAKLVQDDVLAMDCDVLWPCALEGAIHKGNADKVKAKVIAEGANGPVTLEADALLAAKGVLVVPDILANAGGVIVSYYEWVQNRQGFYWSEEEVNAKLKTQIVAAYDRVRKLSTQDKITQRKAAYALAIARIAEALNLRNGQ